MMLASKVNRVLRFSRTATTASSGAATTQHAVDLFVVRGFSSKKEDGKKSFRPRRKPSHNYRPMKAQVLKKKDWSPENDHKYVDLQNVKNAEDDLEAMYGPLGARALRDMSYEAMYPEQHTVEDELRSADYWTAESGTTEEMAFERRALARDTPAERAQFQHELNEAIREGQKLTIDFEDDTMKTYKKKPFADKGEFDHLLEDEDESDDEGEDPENRIDDNQLAHGEWSEMLVGVNRSIKLWRGGRLEAYRALIIGGNCNGCGGFGIGKSTDPLKAVDLAGRKARRNIFFVDRYQGDGLTHDLVGKMNSTKVVIRATDNGLRGNELCMEILKRFGITNAAAKAYDNRHPWNVVRATFKALMTHESIEDVALKRGKRLVSLDRAMRMQI